jgi:hypothetical protein
VLNLSSKADNNFGFNLINFKPEVLKEFRNEVELDYKNSFIGSFAVQLFDNFMKDSGCELLMSMTKFIGNTGFSLISAGHNQAKRAQTINTGFLPDFIPVKDLLEIFEAFCVANKEN